MVHGYKIEKSIEGYRLFKCGGNAGNIAIGDIFNRITKNRARRKERAKQLRAIIRKYKSEIAEGKCQNVENVKVSNGRMKKPIRTKSNSDIKKILDSNGQPLDKETREKIQHLLDTLKNRFGIDIFFQKDKNGQVRGYGIVGHAVKIAFDDSKVLKLSELIDFAIKPERKPSPLDIYRELFTVEVGKDSRGEYMRINFKNSSIYQKSISPRQSAWYLGVKENEREDVGLTVASTMFSEEILTEYLKQHPIHNPLDRTKDVSAVKLRNGNYGIRILLTDGYTPLIEMSRNEKDHFMTIQSDDKAKHDFLIALAVHHLTQTDAVMVKESIKQRTLTQTAARVLPSRPQDYTTEQSKLFAVNLSSVLSSLNVNSAASGHKR